MGATAGSFAPRRFLDRRGSRTAVVALLALVGGYAASTLGYALILRPTGIVFLWPPGGIVLGVLLLAPRREWPAVVVGALIGNVITDATHGASLGLALAGSVANSLESLVAAEVVIRIAGRVRFESLRDLGGFLLGAVLVSNAVTALGGALVLMAYDVQSFGNAWFSWFTGDGIGMLILAPAIVTGAYSLQTRGRVSLRRVAADAAFVAFVILAAVLLLSRPEATVGLVESHAYLTIPLLILAGMRLGPWGATTATLALTSVLAWYAAHGRLATSNATVGQSAQVLEVYTFLALASISALIPAVVLAEREKTALSLLESERRFRQIAENIAEAFFVVEMPDWVPAYVSPSWSVIWGRPISDGHDSRVWFEAIHPDDRATMRAAQEANARGEPSVTNFRIARPDGSVRSLRGRAFPVRDAAGAVVRVVGVAEDVTELHEAELKFNQAQKLEAVGRLAGGVAHDFNNLLTVIFAETEFLAASPLAPDDQASVSEIRHSAESASALTRQLLSFSRRQIVEPRVINVNGVIADTARMIERLIGEDIHINLRLADYQLGVLADRGQLEQLITNLSVNARDAMPRGGTLMIATDLMLDPGPTDVEGAAPSAVGETPKLGWVAISVRDTGTGMPDEVMAHAFEPFFTTKGLGRGTGLGLATCHGIVTQAGGRIGITSKVGVGTTFRILLPRVAVAADVSATTVSVAPGGSERVLLVEDETGVRKATARVLRARGYDVLEARDAEDALRQLADASKQVDLLLTDVVLPGMSGRELSERVHADRPETRTLFASGYTDDVVLHDQMVSHDAAFLAKPFTADSLARRVREVLDDDPAVRATTRTDVE